MLVRSFSQAPHSFARFLSLGFLLALVCEVLPVTTQAACDQPASQISYVYFGNYSSCQIEPLTQVPLGATTLLFVSIRLWTTPISTVRLTIPDPPVGNIESIAWNFPNVGSIDTGVEIDLQGCSAQGGLVLGEIVLQIPTFLTECAHWRIENAEVDDCTGETYAIAPWDQYLNQTGTCIEECYSWQWCSPLPPLDLSPADGSVDVPLDTQLSFSYDYGGGFLYITSDPSCENYDEFYLTTEPWLPEGYLVPDTTYHWYVVQFYQCSNVAAMRSADHTFTTAGPVTAVQKPWGAVKTLFR